MLEIITVLLLFFFSIIVMKMEWVLKEKIFKKCDKCIDGAWKLLNVMKSSSK